MIKRTITRREAVNLLRRHLLEFVDDDHSICEVASRHRIFCKGFSQWTFDELKRRYDWIVERNPMITREELEFLANAWQLSRTKVLGTRIACDSQEQEHDTCFGWDEFTVDQLEHYLLELTGMDVVVLTGGERE
jgi:hypothetical protein